MKESLARIHVHELEVPETKRPIPEAANDNVELPPPRFVAANDNEIGPVVVASRGEGGETAQLLSETRSRLSMAVEVPATEEGAEEEPTTPEELPQLKPENLQEVEESLSPEKVAAQSNVESVQANSEASAAQSAGGASGNEDVGGSSRDGRGSSGGGGSASAFAEAGKEGGKVFSGIGKILKYALLAPLWLIGALIAGGLKMVSSITNKIFTSAKLTKGEGGGGGGSKSAGGSGGSKPSGGGGGHH